MTILNNNEKSLYPLYLLGYGDFFLCHGETDMPALQAS